MKIKVLNADGVHRRELKGLDALKGSLPDTWYGYASLEMTGHNGGEIDLVICAEDRLIAVEIKDWNGKIIDHGQRWETRGRIEKSPVITIAEKSKKLASKLKTFLGTEQRAPWVDHCVLLTGNSRRSDLSEDSKAKTFELNFFKNIGTGKTYRESFPTEAWSDTPISDLKPKLDQFFSGPRVRPQTCAYNGYKADTDPCYTHPKKIYSEYFAEKIGAKGFKALLRRWDFQELGAVDSAYMNKENRSALALREENAISYLRQTKPDLASKGLFLAPISNEGRESVTENFYELYDLPGDLARLKESLRRYANGLKEDNRVSIARLLLSHLAELHDLEVAHRDIGEHCVWVSVPDKVSLSGFATSSFPEQKTVSQIRDTIRGGNELIPEELLDAKSDNFRKDVFLLGSLIHQIMFGCRPHLVDSVPTWNQPENHKFEQYWGWFERALELEPTKRFADARAAFDEFQRCSSKVENPDCHEEEFREFTRQFPPLPRQGEDEILRESSDGLVFRSKNSNGDYSLVKVWHDAKFKPGFAADNYHLLNFLIRIQRLQTADLPCQQRITDFGLTNFGTYVQMEWRDGPTLSKFEGECSDEKSSVEFIKELIRSVHTLHSREIYHGDLKPENILYNSDTEGRPIFHLIDLVDYAPAGCTRRSSAYIPPEGEEATTPACDGYALKKIINDFLLPCMNELSAQIIDQISRAMDDMLDPDGGTPDTRGALETLDKILNPDVEKSADSSEIKIFIKQLDEDIKMTPDDRGLPITISPNKYEVGHHVVRINSQSHCLRLNVDSSHSVIVEAVIQNTSFRDLIQSLRRKRITLESSLIIQKGDTDDLSELTLALEKSGLFSVLTQDLSSAHANDKISDASNTPHREASQDRDTNEDTSEDGDSLEEPKIDSVPLEALWEALLDEESKIVPQAVIVDDPVEITSSQLVVLPVGEFTAPFDPQDDEIIEVSTLDSEGEWRFYGILDNRKSSDERVVVTTRTGNKYRPFQGTSIRLENRASRASFDKRLSAIQRIISRESVCRRLFDYFNCTGTNSEGAGRFTSRLEELEKYGLNETQKDALSTALRYTPLSLIQGPPGTGKTGVISSMVHYIATNYPTAKILIVSQSHEAIDHATEQIVKRFRLHSNEPSLVRVGRRGAISDDLISYHSESLQGEYRERFRLSLRERIIPIGRRLGLADSFTEELVIMRGRISPLIQQLDTIEHEGDSGIDQAVKRQLENACKQLDPEFDFESVPISSVGNLLEERLVERHQETDTKSVNALKKVIDIAIEWVRILETPGKLDRFYVSSCQIVAGTCIGIGRWHLGVEKENFDCVIIDEAARCGPGDLAVASQVAQQVVLVGDHKQLPPFLEREVAANVSRELNCDQSYAARSDFQRIFDSPYASHAGRTLNTQYRMREPIGRLVSECFYQESHGIRAGRNTSPKCYDQLPQSISNFVTWFDTADGFEERVGTSFTNESEIDQIINLLEEIDNDQNLVDELILDAESDGLPAAIGIIAAYKAQADAIEARIWGASFSDRLRQTCKVGTVDSYQGKENPVVIFSPVRCNPYDEIGFIRSWERVNVSLSRAKERLVIVGSWSFWESSGNNAPLGRVVNFITERINEGDQNYCRNTSITNIK